MNTLSVSNTQEVIALEKHYGAHNYAPLEVVLAKGSGVHLWDVEGKHYFDFLSAYGAVNQGHCHPAIVKALVDQAAELTLTSRAFYNNQLGRAEEYVCKLFAYEKALFMNSGAEAVETAIKIARKWGYQKKGIAEGKATIVVVEGNFHGRTTGIISFSSDSSNQGFAPFMPGFIRINYNDVSAFESILKTNGDVCAMLVEPIQGEAGVIIPEAGYLADIKALCEKYNVLLLADEIQTGLGRTGKMLCSEYENVRADVLILGKALSGGMLPVSVVLADDEIMLCIKPGEHGSTYGGNPLAAAVTIAALEVLKNEDLAANAFSMGKIFRKRMLQLQQERPGVIAAVRGRGLLNALDILPSADGRTAKDLCHDLKDKGLLAKPTHQHTIRFSPPLVITQEEIIEGCNIIETAVKNF